MISTEQIREFAAELDREMTRAQERASQAEENLGRAQEERASAKKAVLEAQQQRDGFRRTFAQQLGLAADDEAEEHAPRQSLQLVPKPTRTKSADVAKMTVSDQLKHILGNRTMTLDELREELKARKLSVPNLSKILSQTKHNVRDATGAKMRDPKTGDLVKENTFVSPSRGSWRVAEPEPESEPRVEVLSRAQVQAEMLMNRTTARRQ